MGRDSVARTYVFLSTTQYMVAEPFEEVRDAWVNGLDAVLKENAAVVNLTVVTGYFDPYPVAISPGAISHIEECQPFQIEYSVRKSREAWEEREREDKGGTGFG